MTENYKMEAVFGDGSTIQSQDIDQSQYDIIRISDDQLHVLYNNKSYVATIIEKDVQLKQYTIDIEGQRFQVALKDELDMQIDQMGMNKATNVHIKELRSPMPGLILDIMAKDGMEINQDDKLFTLEAMKMENIIKSPLATTIAKVHVTKGEKVDKGQLLVTFE